MGLDTGLVAEIWARGSEPRWAVGSGCLVGEKLLLTAAHVVTPSSTVQVRLLDEGVLHDARVVWHGRTQLDAALVEITDPSFEPGWRSPARFGRLVSSVPSVPCEAVGFPDVMRFLEDPELLRRDSEHLAGYINPLARSKQDLLDIRVDSGPDDQIGQISPWAGMSGAAVWSGDLLVGSVGWAPRGFRQSRLTAVPIEALAVEEGFRRAVTSATGRKVLCEPVELQDLVAPWFPAQGPHSPAALLRAEHEVVPFRGRERTLQALLSWCKGPDTCSSLLLTGPGGQGKTRLARRLCELLAGEDWVVGQIAETTDVSTHLTTLKQCTAPVLLVLDYVETRPEQAQQIIDYLVGHPPHCPVRLLLLARASGEWFTALRSASTAMSTTVRPEPLRVEAFTITATEREAAWQEALTALGNGLQLLDEVDITVGLSARSAGARPSAFAASDSIQALTLHVAALAKLLSEQPEPDLPPQQLLLAHERRYWQRVADRRDLDMDQIRPLAMAAAQLSGPAPRADALHILAQVPGLRGEMAEQDRRALAEWIRDLYPPPATGDAYWGSLQPDPLAEQYLIDSIASEPELAVHVLPACTPEQLRHALTLLSRAAARPGGKALMEALSLFVHAPHSKTEDLQRLYAVMPDQPQAFAELAAELATRLVTLLRTSRDRADLAGWLTNQASRLGSLGRPGDALKAATEAVDAYRQLAEDRPDGYLASLAGSLHNQSTYLSSLGRLEESLRAATEAVTIRRSLAEEHPNAYRPDLASSLTSQSNQLASLGRQRPSLEATIEAVGIYRHLAEEYPDAYLPGLAGSLHNQSLSHYSLGELEEALGSITEAIKIRRRLTAAGKEEFEPLLAESVQVQARLLNERDSRQGEGSL
ncbi:trypsin-like peptidase domain-containing protein [Streptomyces hayashii]|uniref:trypsin-like peptidase domain-containing protein n=1 Tax=Streptomyces hayashii TaxID=2839966 RepID=UPI00403C56CD